MIFSRCERHRTRVLQLSCAPSPRPDLGRVGTSPISRGASLLGAMEGLSDAPRSQHVLGAVRCGVEPTCSDLCSRRIDTHKQLPVGPLQHRGPAGSEDAWCTSDAWCRVFGVDLSPKQLHGLPAFQACQHLPRRIDTHTNSCRSGHCSTWAQPAARMLGAHLQPHFSCSHTSASRGVSNPTGGPSPGYPSVELNPKPSQHETVA